MGKKFLAPIGLIALMIACNGPDTPTRTLVSTPLVSIIQTPTAPSNRKPTTPQPAVTSEPSATPAPATSAPATPGSLATNWKLKLLYQWHGSDQVFVYSESLTGNATYAVAADGIVTGQGSATYNQGLTTKTPADCEVPLGLVASLKVSGQTEQTSTGQFFHLQIVVQFQGIASTTVSCTLKPTGLRIGIPVSGSTDVLNPRAARFPWADFRIPVVLGIYSVPISSEGLDWSKTGTGDLTITILPSP